MEKIFKNRKIIFICSVIILIGVMIWAWLSCRDLPKTAYDLDFWRGNNAVFRDGAYSVDDEIMDSGISSDFLWGPNGELKKGSYTAFIEYHADEDQKCIATAVQMFEKKLVDSSECILSRHLHSAVFQFEIREDIQSFWIVFPTSK